MWLFAAASKLCCMLAQTLNRKIQALSKRLLSVVEMLQCMAADARVAHCSHEGAFRGVKVCNKLFWSKHCGKHARVENLGEKQNNDKLHQL